MPYVTIEDRVDRLEGLFGQFIAQTTLIQKRADDRMARFEQEMREFKNEMLEFKNEMREFKDEMREFKKESVASRKEMNKKWGDLANKMGTIVEDILAPNLRRLATEYFGFPAIHEIMMRWNRKKPNTPASWQEFDLVITGPDAAIVGEAKSSMNLEAADKFAEKLKGFGEFAPHLAHLRVIPVIGCWSMPPQVVDKLSDLGIYAMCMGDETMEIINGDAVKNEAAA